MQNHGRNPKKANYIFKKELRHLWGCQFLRPSKHRDQTCELAIFAHAADEPVVTMNQRHAKHEVNSPPPEFLVGQELKAYDKLVALTAGSGVTQSFRASAFQTQL